MTTSKAEDRRKVVALIAEMETDSKRTHRMDMPARGLGETPRAIGTRDEFAVDDPESRPTALCILSRFNSWAAGFG